MKKEVYTQSYLRYSLSAQGGWVSAKHENIKE